MKDSKLVQGLQSHRRKLQDVALEQLYFRNSPLIEGYILRNSGSKEDAEEVLQDTLVVVFQAVRKPNFELTSKIDTFIYGIARNIWLKRLRKKRRKVETVAISGNESALELKASEPETQAVSEKMLQIIRQMSPRCQEILTLLYVEEKNINETMEALQYMSAQAVRNKKSNCLKKLRAYFQNSKNRNDLA